jgi:uncharacterized protein YndB with AHSA1/START domain
MKTYTYTTTTDVPAAKLYDAIADIARWPDWDGDIEATTHDGATAPGSPFSLKPKGGPKVSMEIVEATAPARFVDLARLPLGRMRTSHVFTPDADGTRIDVKIEVWGFLGFLWDRVVARKQAAGAADQTQAFLAYAASRP